jgi:hypothetical protein
MKAIPLNDQTRELAKRLVWFETPEEALANPTRFMAYAFARATHRDMHVLRCFLDETDMRDALDHAPPGIIDPRSWCYWNVKLGRYPAPPMPKRLFGIERVVA